LYVAVMRSSREKTKNGVVCAALKIFACRPLFYGMSIYCYTSVLLLGKSVRLA